MATFPGGVHDFGSPHVDDIDEIIHAYEINDPNAEIVAIETWLRANLVTARTMHDLTIDSPAVALNTRSGFSTWATPGWFVDGAGVCHWYGVVDTHGLSSSTEFLHGAPAPADGKIHQFRTVVYNESSSSPPNPVDRYSLEPASGWALPFTTGYSLGSFTLSDDGYVRLSGVIQSGSTYGYGSYICALPRDADNLQHFYWVKDLDGGNDLQLMLDQYGNLLTGPLANSGQGSHAGHRYSLEGLYWKAAGPTNLLVMANGNGRIDGLVPYGFSWIGANDSSGPAHYSLDGVSYYVGL